MEYLPHPPKRIIIRMPNWLGDFVMATPILADVRAYFPKAKIFALCQGVLKDVIAHDPHIDEVIPFKRPRGLPFGKKAKECISSLKKGNYDLGILLTNSFSSAYWFWQAGIPYRLGYKDHWRTPFLNIPVPFPTTKESQHLVITYKMLLDPLEIPVSKTAPQLYVTESEKLAARKTLASYGILPSDLLLGINPGAAYGSAKCWLPDRFTKLTLQLLHSSSAKIVYFGDKQGAPLVEKICNELPSERVVNLSAKTTLRELIALTQCCHLFLTNDSGPMHIASALKIPLIALFGSTSDRATGPYNGGLVIHKHVSCSPCYLRTCPIDFRCMKQIEVDEVYQQIQKFIH